MKKQYNTKQTTKKQQQSGSLTKLHRAHSELGFKEPSKTKHYYAILSNGKVEDYDTTAPIFARLYFEEIASVLGLQVISVRAYQ